MFHQVTDFLNESDSLCRLLASLNEKDFRRHTQFNQWTINNVIGHLHMWNWAADLALERPQAFQQFLDQVMISVQHGKLRAFEENWLEGVNGRVLCDTWRDCYRDMSRHYGSADPKARVAWAGPDMSVRSSITARLMETWAHGQAVYDLLGVKRVNTDRIKNIVVLGIKTFGWTFKNRDLPVPETPPRLRLTAPSGDIWEFNESTETDSVEGDASEFCQVVTQVRNVEDTSLNVSGDNAARWMSFAQCFAGPPRDPPAPGSRFTVV